MHHTAVDTGSAVVRSVRALITSASAGEHGRQLAAPRPARRCPTRRAGRPGCRSVGTNSDTSSSTMPARREQLTAAQAAQAPARLRECVLIVPGPPSRARTAAGGSLQARGLERVAQQHRDRHRPDAAGHGRDRRGHLGDGLEVDVADEAALVARLLRRQPVHADVDHDRPGRDEARRSIMPRAPDGRDQDRRRARTPPRRSRVREWQVGDGRVGLQQQLGHRLAEQVRAPDDDRLGALQLDARLAQQLHHAQRRARAQAGPPERRAARR